MRIDTTLIEKDLIRSGDLAVAAEKAGHDTVWCTETGLDPFLQAYEVGRRTETVATGTAIAVALARNPMTVAYSAWNIAQVSQGRFTLGIGSQVKAHIERRYSMTWDRPVSQMREFILATRAIWESWRTGERLDFQGDHYTHTLMSPFWAPMQHDYRIPIHVAAVGPRMVEMACNVADGILLHAFTNPAYLDKVTFPAIDAGLSAAGRTASSLDVSIPMFMAMGDTDEEIETRQKEIAAQLAFYASTPSYRPVLDAIGYGDLQPELTAMSKSGQWEKMSSLVSAELLDHFSISGRPEQMPSLARAHLGERANRTSSYYGWPVSDPDRLKEIFADFRQENKTK